MHLIHEPAFLRLPAAHCACWSLRAAAASAGLAWADDYSDVTLLIQSGKLAEALAKADQYLAAKPRDPQMRFLKGVAQTDAGRTADAIATFTSLNEEYPELPEPYNNLAVLYAGQAPVRQGARRAGNGGSCQSELRRGA